MKNIKGILLIIAISFASISVYSQSVSLESLKKENSQLKKDLAKTKQAKDSLQLRSAKLMQDTTFLRNELSLCRLYNNGQRTEILNSNSNFKATFLYCKGSRASQSVELSFMIEHNIPNQKFTNNEFNSDKGKAYDTQGQVYNASSTFMGGAKINYCIIPTNNPMKISLVFNNVHPGNDLFKIITFIYDSHNIDRSNRQKGILEFKNTKIIWD